MEYYQINEITVKIDPRTNDVMETIETPFSSTTDTIRLFTKQAYTEIVDARGGWFQDNTKFCFHSVRLVANLEVSPLPSEVFLNTYTGKIIAVIGEKA